MDVWATERAPRFFTLIFCLQAVFPQGGLAVKLARLAMGIDGEVVEARMLAKSMSCGKTFR